MQKTTTRSDSRPAAPAPSPCPRADAAVRIHNAVAGVLAVLEIDAPFDDDLGRIVQSALFDLRVQVVRVHSQRSRRRMRQEYEVVEFDGAPLRGSRQLEVRAALDALLKAS